jgi:hypothetical protein
MPLIRLFFCVNGRRNFSNFHPQTYFRFLKHILVKENTPALTSICTTTFSPARSLHIRDNTDFLRLIYTISQLGDVSSIFDW